MIKPLAEYLVVEKSKTEQSEIKTRSGLALPISTDSTSSYKAHVIAVGNDVEDIKVGDDIYINDWVYASEVEPDEYIINKKIVIGIAE